jgi:MoaA/NifB/PqqE/SkfB family radical SAM enzyme
MSNDDARAFLAMLEKFRPPSLLLSGGEPMAHPDFFSRLSMAYDYGMRVTLSTNGTLIDRDAARRMSHALVYAGVSIDGPCEVNDLFRGSSGAFRASVEAIDLLASMCVKVGLRVTLARPLLPYLPDIFNLAESLPISRVCFYHFIPSGRGASDDSLTPTGGEASSAVGRIIEWADEISRNVSRRDPLEILTVGDASDSVRIYKYLLERNDSRLPDAAGLLTRASSGCSPGILSVRWDGTVFPNQFAWDRPLGRWPELKWIAGHTRRHSEVSSECGTCSWRSRNICAGRLELFNLRNAESCAMLDCGQGTV